MITFSPKFTAAQLKRVALLCGKSKSGTKTAITERITDGLEDFKPLAPGTRVLSIDLGIRNLAYSLLEVPENSAKKKRRNTEYAASLPPILHAWERLALIPKVIAARKAPKKKRKKAAAAEETSREELSMSVLEADTVSKPKGKAKKGKKPIPEEIALDTQASTIASLEDDPTTTAIPIEDFSPTRLSSLAVELIITRLLPLKPDLVILEQQRFRSMGGSSVLEWTLRVNSLESMLYAVFTTLRQLGQWPNGKLEGVVARNVLEFMAVQEGEGANIWAKETKNDNKRLKKDIIRRIVDDHAKVKIGGGHGVEQVVKEYVDKWEMKGKRGKTGAETLKKLDDLADCLLQGLAYIRWQENNRRLLTGGVEGLEDQMTEF